VLVVAQRVLLVRTRSPSEGKRDSGYHDDADSDETNGHRAPFNRNPDAGGQRRFRLELSPADDVSGGRRKAGNQNSSAAPMT
jgi:hypothetical protein